LCRGGRLQQPEDILKQRFKPPLFFPFFFFCLLKWRYYSKGKNETQQGTARLSPSPFFLFFFFFSQMSSNPLFWKQNIITAGDQYPCMALLFFLSFFPPQTFGRKGRWVEISQQRYKEYIYLISPFVFFFSSLLFPSTSFLRTSIEQLYRPRFFEYLARRFFSFCSPAFFNSAVLLVKMKDEGWWSFVG